MITTDYSHYYYSIATTIQIMMNFVVVVACWLGRRGQQQPTTATIGSGTIIIEGDAT